MHMALFFNSDVTPVQEHCISTLSIVPWLPLHFWSCHSYGACLHVQHLTLAVLCCSLIVCPLPQPPPAHMAVGTAAARRHGSAGAQLTCATTATTSRDAASQDDKRKPLVAQKVAVCASQLLDLRPLCRQQPS